MSRILVAGGGMNNKGAQAMLYTVIYELKSVYPECEICVAIAETLYQMPDLNAEVLALRPMSWRYLLGGRESIKAFIANAYYSLREFASNVIHNRKKKACLNRLLVSKKIMQEIVAMLDISGYSLSSSCGDFQTKVFLDRIQAMRKFGVKTYLLPQSFGPFNYTNKSVVARITDLLSYPSIIWAREKTSQEYLLKIGIDSNVRLSTDIVLQNKSIDYNKVLKNVVPTYNISIPQNTVAVIPNQNIGYKCKDGRSLSSLYSSCISILRKRGISVLLMWHSEEDKPIVEAIKAEYNKDVDVMMLDHAVSSIEFVEYIKHASFCIASRYHSIIQSLKNCVPCVVIGWAEKYEELLGIFGQGEYCFDIRHEPDNAEIVKAIERMIDNLESERSKIRCGLGTCQGYDIFNEIKKDEAVSTADVI